MSLGRAGALLGLLVWALSCQKKEVILGAGPAPRSWTDTTRLRVDSATVNGARTDTLAALPDTLSCDTLAQIRVYLSKVPRFKYGAACRSTRFDNFGNPRFACHTCLKFPGCKPGDSLSYVSFQTIADSVEVLFVDTVVQASGDSTFDTSSVHFSTPHSILTFRLVETQGLGFDTGRCAVVLDSLFDGTSDSLILSDSLEFHWKQ